MTSIARGAVAVTLACSTLAGLGAVSSASASTPVIPALNTAALQAAIQR